MPPKDYFFDGALSDADPEVARLSAVEAERQMRKLILIASESLCPAPVREALASEFVNLYAEGYPSTRMSLRERDRIGDHARGLSYFNRYADRRYYKGTEFCDIVESLAEIRLAEIFASKGVPAGSIFANVQPLSGAAANNAVYEAFAMPGCTVMGMALPHGGHLTHGSEFNRSGKTYRIVPYSVSRKTGRLDYDRIMELARAEKPRMIIVGFSAYPWSVDWKAFREIADASGAILFADIAHTAGLVAGGVHPNPVGLADVVTFTTHKTLCGPRGAAILTTDPDRARAVDNAVFPGEQGGPHLHTIAAKAVAFRLASTPAFRELQKRVVENAAALAEGFRKRGIPLAYGGTDTHLLLIDCKKVKTANGGPLQADIASRILDLAGITLNKNTIAGDEKAAQPSGLRFGTTILTQRGFGTEDMDRLAGIVTRLLSSIHAFEVQGQDCRLGRAKLPAGVFMETRKAVAEFDLKGASMAVERIGRYPYFVAVPGQAGNGEAAPMVDGGKPGHFLVRGERAPAFLHAVLGADVLGLEPLSSVQTVLLDAQAKLLDTVALTRLEDGEWEEPRFLLRTSAESAVEASEWLRALSDGYVDIGAGDLYAKVEGPVVVETAPGASLTPEGPEAEGAWEALKEACAKGARPALAEIAAKAPPEAVAPYKTFFVGAKAGSLPDAGKALPEFRYRAAELPLRRTPLFKEHLKLTKKRNVIPFAGWEMPVVYTSISEEHRAVREGAGLFDVGHMGVFEASGPNACRFLDLATTNYVPKLAVGESQYAYLLDPHGSCIDDLMIYRIGRERYMIVVNAVNAEKDWAWLLAYNSGKFLLDPDRPGARIEAPAVLRDLKDRASGADMLIDLALQGPRSIDVLASLARDSGTAGALSALARNTNASVTLAGLEVIVSRTGYTGEEWGYEIYVHPDRAVEIWKRLLEAGREFGVVPVGLGARDSTRTEAGLPLYGHELAGDLDIDPIEAGYEYFVKWHKPFFAGRKELLKRMLGRKREIVRFRARGVGARLAHTGDPVVNRNGKTIGHVTSSALAGEDQIGMALVDRKAAAVDAPVSLYCLPPSGRAPKEGPKSELKQGDRVLLPVEGRIVPRFPAPD